MLEVDAEDVIRDQNIVLFQVRDELDRQLMKWGPQWHTPVEWISIETEELGEAGMEANNAYFGAKYAPVHEMTKDEFEAHVRDVTAHLDALEVEAIQVAAVAIALVESIRRQRRLDLL